MSRPFARPLRIRARLLPAIALGLGLSAASAAMAGDVYTWKDANGVTHYSQTPPPKGTNSQYRMFIHAKREGPKKAAESPVAAQCATARSNIALLESNQSVSRDTDGDGKPDTNLSASERAQQLELARMVVRANCAKVPATTASAPAQATQTPPAQPAPPKNEEPEREEGGY